MTLHLYYKLPFLIVLTSLLLGGCDKNTESLPSPSGRSVSIGIIAPMTGPDYPKGQDGLRGIKTILHGQSLLNNGDKVEILVENDKNEADLSIKAFKKLVEKDKVSAVLVLSTSNSVLALNKIVDTYKTPVLATIASHPDIALNTRYMNQLCIDNNFQGKVAALYARDELLVTRAAVFKDSSNEHSLSLADVFKEQFHKIGGRIEEPIVFSRKKEIVKAQLISLKQQDIEMLYLPVDANQFIFISQILPQIPWKVKRMGNDGLLSTVLAKHTEDLGLVNNSIGIDFYSTDADRSFFGRSLAKTYLKLFSQKPNTYTIAGAEGIALILNAMNRCKTQIDRDEINTQIRKTDKFKGFIGRVSIGSDGKSRRPLIVNTINERELKFLVRVH